MKDNWPDAQFATAWDERHLVGNPTRPFLLSVVVAVLAARAAKRSALSILELGAGTGLVSDRVLDSVSNATIDGVDFSEPMMARATERLARHGTRFRQHRADLAASDVTLPENRYDAALILQVLHEIPPDAKRRVLHLVRARLAPDGILLYGERLRAGYDVFADAHAVVWNEVARWTTDTEQPSFDARVQEVTGKTDFTQTLSDEFRLFEETGYAVEPLLVLGERCLLAAVPRAQAAAT